MANLTETPTYEAGIYRFETTDPVQGGPGGIDNLPTNQLANRTAWLKAQVEAILLDIAAIESGYATAASITSHTGNTSNPHAVTKAQVGLGSVLNYGVATQAEAEAGAIDTKYMTPLRARQATESLFKGSNVSIASSGYQRLPSGIILQWGSLVAPAGVVSMHSFPIAFPTLCRSIVFSVGIPGGDENQNIAPFSQTQFRVENNHPVSARSGFWIAIGN